MTDQVSPPSPEPAAPAPVPLLEPVPPTTHPDGGPNYIFFVVVSLVSLVADLATKGWAKGRLTGAGATRRIEVIHDHLAFVFRENQGGAFGLLQDQPEAIRRPFFISISIIAIVFIISLYRKLTPQQLALKWGLPLVLGGALGNLVNRIQYNYVVDFIDFRASWLRPFNNLLHNPTDHWPTFNIADVAIVMGVGLMAIDMFTPRTPAPVEVPPVAADAAPAPVVPPPAASMPAGEAAPKASPAETAPRET